jgi:hypothetical protein
MVLCLAGTAKAADIDNAREEMQRKLNEQVINTPFNPGDIKKAEVYAETAKKEGVVPVARPPAYWLPGWTCGNLIAYQYYYYGDYRNCIYYHYYYGRYW